MKKRIFSILLSALMVMSLLPGMAMAGGTPGKNAKWGVLQNALAGTETHSIGDTIEIDNNTIKLLDNITADTADTTLTVSGEKTLDLNGHVINANGNSIHVITVSSNAILTLEDSQPNKTHNFNVDNTTGLWTLDETNGTKTVKGGVITGGNAQYGGGVYVNTSGEFNMSGGSITGNTATGNGGGVVIGSGTFTMTDGSITGNTAQYGGGVYNDGTFTMDAGTITDNTATTGGGVYTNNNVTIGDNAQITGNESTNGGGGVHNNAGTLTLKGGTISNNTTGVSGGGVFSNAGTFNMEGGTISGNQGTYSGGVLNNNNSTFNMTGGTISNNMATDNVGGVGNVGTFKMTGGTITGNKCGSNAIGGGVYHGDGTFTLGGTAKIINNKKGNIDQNVYLPSEKYITFGSYEDNSKAPASGMSVGVTTQTAPEDSNPVKFTVENENAKDYMKYFFSDNSNYYVAKNSSNYLELKKPVAGCYAINVIPSENGEIEPNVWEAHSSDPIYLKVMPATGYQLKSLKYNDGATDHDITNAKQFTMPLANVTVTAKFEKPSSTGAPIGWDNPQSITVESSTNGTVSANKKSAPANTVVTLTVAPDENYVLDTLTVLDSTSRKIETTDAGDGTYTFRMSQNPVTVSATFTKDEEAALDEEKEKEKKSEAVKGGSEVKETEEPEELKESEQSPEQTEEEALKHSIVLQIGNLDMKLFGESFTNDVVPIIRNDRAMLPARVVAEALGANVFWNEEARKVTVQRGTLTIEIFVDSAVAYVDGVEVALDSPAFIENARTYVPMRFLAEALGATVAWDEENQKVIITPITPAENE